MVVFSQGLHRPHSRLECFHNLVVGIAYERRRQGSIGLPEALEVLELELELIQPHMTKKPVLRGEV